MQSKMRSVPLRFICVVECPISQLFRAQSSISEQQARIIELEGLLDKAQVDLESAKVAITAMTASNETAAAEALAAVQVEHQALLQAHEDLASIKSESEALIATHAAAMHEIQAKVAELEARAAAATAEVEALGTEREETEARVSELEIEVLELKEAAETAVDDKAARVQALEEQLAVLSTQTEEAAEKLKTFADAHAAALADKEAGHVQATRSLMDEVAKLAADLAVSV